MFLSGSIELFMIFLWAYILNFSTTHIPSQNIDNIPDDAICYKVLGYSDKYWAFHWYGIFPNPPELINAYGSLNWENNETQNILVIKNVYLLRVYKECLKTFEISTSNYKYTSLKLNLTIHVGKDNKNPLTQFLIKIQPQTKRNVKMLRDTVSFMELYTIFDPEKIFVSESTPTSYIENIDEEINKDTYDSEYICIADKMTLTSVRPIYDKQLLSAKAYQAVVVGLYSNGQLRTVKRFNAWPCSDLQSLIYLPPIYLVIGDDIQNYEIIWKVEGLGEDGTKIFPLLINDAKKKDYFTTIEVVERYSKYENWLINKYRLFLIDEINEFGQCFDKKIIKIWKVPFDGRETLMLLLEELLSDVKDVQYYRYYSILDIKVCV